MTLKYLSFKKIILNKFLQTACTITGYETLVFGIKLTFFSPITLQSKLISGEKQLDMTLERSLTLD